MTNSRLLCAVVVGSMSIAACSKKGATPEAEGPYATTTVTTGGTAEGPTRAEQGMARAEEGAAAGTSVTEPGPVGARGPAWEEQARTEPPQGMPQAAPEANPAMTMPLTDGQIVRVTESVDKGEIEQAKEVQKKARSPEVKKLAANLVQQHTKSKQKSQTLLRRAQITPEDSPIATDLTMRAEQSLQAIKAAAPVEAERTFLDAQMRQHEEVLELLDKRLIPSAMNPELKAQLEETRKMIEKHMEETKRVQQAIGASPTMPPSG